MTLLGAVQSLGIVELATVSWITISPADARHAVVFTMALVLPILDPALSAQLGAGRRRFWPDQTRWLDVPPPIEEQIEELHQSQILGSLFSVRIRARWIVETHAGAREERMDWLRSVITMEGRLPNA